MQDGCREGVAGGGEWAVVPLGGAEAARVSGLSP